MFLLANRRFCPDVAKCDFGTLGTERRALLSQFSGPKKFLAYVPVCLSVSSSSVDLVPACSFGLCGGLAVGDGFSGPSSGFVSAVILVFSCFLLSLELFSLGGLGVACAGFLSFVAQLVCVAGEQGGGGGRRRRPEPVIP